MDILDQLKLQADERVAQYADKMRCESQLEGAFVHACMAVINNRRLSTCDSNRAMLESLLNPGEMPSPKLYVALAEQFPTRFTWDTPQSQPTKEEQRAAFDAFARDNNLSTCEANFQLFKQSANTEKFAQASEEEAQTEHDAAVQAESERRHQFVLGQQQHYPALPATNGNGETIDAAYLRKLSTINYPLFKRLVQKHGSGNVTSRLRGEN
jgi:hypothetical protein